MRLSGRTSIDDLVGAGFVALVETYKRAGDLPPEDFTRLAISRIRGAILDELRRADDVPRSTRLVARRLRNVRRALAASLERAPTSAELFDASGVSRNAYLEAARVITPPPQAYVTKQDDGSFMLVDETPEDCVLREERLERARDAYAALPERLRGVLDLYYGEDRSLRQIGAVLGVTEARASQLLSRAVETLKASGEE